MVRDAGNRPLARPRQIEIAGDSTPASKEKLAKAYYFHRRAKGKSVENFYLNIGGINDGYT